jgi:hypothetical protein
MKEEEGARPLFPSFSRAAAVLQRRQGTGAAASNGKNRLLAIGANQAKAWYNATLQARELGLRFTVASE